MRGIYHLMIFYCEYTFKVVFVVVCCLVAQLWPHRLQHARCPCPSPSPGACSNSCPLSQWCHPPISSSVVPFSSCLQYFPASGSFPMSQLFPSGGHRTGASASASVLPVNTQNWFPLGLTCLGSLYFYLLNLTTVSRGKMKILLIRGECTLVICEVTHGQRLDCHLVFCKISTNI